MISSPVQARKYGMKKQITDRPGTVDNIRELDVCKSFITGHVCHCCDILCSYHLAGGDMMCRDNQTGETFLHVLTDYTHLYLTANSTRIVYLLSTKVDLDVPDHNGDTVLHKVVRVTGAWRFIVALMRCGACPLKRNKAGRTAEEEILHLKNPGWEENLHWLRKYLPGLWAAVKSKNPDPVLIERMLRYWCRTVKIVGNQTENLKCQVHLCDTQLDLVCILEKYENTNELALAMLSGKAKFISLWKTTDILQKVDVNTKDHSYQFYYRDYHTAPRPLLASVWEIEHLELIKAFMELNPDTAVKYTFESEADSPPKPLFFQLVNPKSRPHNEAITEHILKYSDLNIRNIQGQTVLVEAMYNRETEGVIRVILNSGINVGARDALGRTARDHCDILKREDYKQLIDSYVIELIQECDIECIETLVLQMYDHIIPPANKNHIMCIAKRKGSKQLTELLKNIDCKQNNIKKLFALVKSGNKTQLVKQMNRKYGNVRDKAGRTLLHYAIQHSHVHNCCNSPINASHTTSSSYNNITGNEEVILQDISVSQWDSSNTLTDTTQQHNVCKWRRCMIGDMTREKKKRPCFIKFCGQNHFTPDHLGIIKYLIHEYPSMLGVINNIGQTPLHYAHIFSTYKEVIDLLEKASSCAHIKDVFDFVPEDYDRNLCGSQTFSVRRRPTVDLDLDIFLTESNFEVNFQQTIQSKIYAATMMRLAKNLVPSTCGDWKQAVILIFSQMSRDQTRKLQMRYVAVDEVQAHKAQDLFTQQMNSISECQHFGFAKMFDWKLRWSQKLITPLLEHGGETKFSSALFDCVDKGHLNLASFLVEIGFPTDIVKQYEVCDPDDSMCAMMECSHAVTTFRQRAVDVGATDLVRFIDNLTVDVHPSAVR